MTHNFTIILAIGVIFALPVLGFIWWRFGGPDTLSFIVVSGGFSAVMDFISSFVARNYEYPRQSPVWVFTFIFFGWMAMCGTCLLMAEGILVRPGHDMLTQRRLWWQLPLLSSAIAVMLDLFIDPIAVAAGYWVWFVHGSIYYGIPLLNFVGWFVLIFLSSMAFILIAKRRHWGYLQKVGVAIGALVPLAIAAVALSFLLNSAIATFGIQ